MNRDSATINPTPAIERAPRLDGLDIARALAIFGMFAAHIGPTGLSGPLGALYTFPHGRASLLFAVLAGLGIGLLTGRGAADTTTRILWRATILMVIGLALQTLGHGIAVILQYYAVLFLASLYLAPLPVRKLTVITIGALLLGPSLFALGAAWFPDAFTRHIVGFGTPIDEMVRGLLFTGSYPALTWLGPFCVGLLLARLPLADPAVQLALVKWGLACFVASHVLSFLLEVLLDYPPNDGVYGLIYIRPHDQSHLWLASGTGAALAVTGACLRLGQGFPGPLRWLITTGRLAFSLYILQILAFSLAPSALRATAMQEGLLILLLAGTACILIAQLMAAAWGAGPMEWLLRRPFRPASARAKR